MLAWRLVATVPIIALTFTALSLWPLVQHVFRQLGGRRLLIPILLIDSGLFGLQLCLLLSCACAFLAMTPDRTAPFTTHPHLAVGVLLLGVLSAAGFLAYLRAIEILSFAVFGLLGYLEPVLLVAIAVAALGESFSGLDALIYGPIVVGLSLLCIESVRAPERRPIPPSGF